MYGQAIRERSRELKDLGISKTEIARMLGISRSTVYNILDEAPRTIVPSKTTAPMNEGIRNIQNSIQSVRRESSSGITRLEAETLIMRRDIQLNSENLKTTVKEVNRIKDCINEIKDSTKNLWILWASVNDIYNKIKEIKSDIEFLTMGNLVNSTSINNLKSQISCQAEIAKIQIQNSMELTRLEFNEKLNHQNLMQELKEITELIKRKNNGTTFYNSSFLNLRPIEVSS